jgi:hypothetical protein
MGLGQIGAIENEKPGLTLRIAWIGFGEQGEGQRRRRPNRQFLSKAAKDKVRQHSNHAKSPENTVGTDAAH